MNAEYKIGEKIKNRRIAKGITQSELTDGKITRSMLSLIESGKAFPSVETAEYLCQRLDLPLSYLFSTESDLFYFEKKEKIGYIKELLLRKNYMHCISVLESLSSFDDETNYILATANFELGKEYVRSGSLLSALKPLKTALDLTEKTIYNTERISICAPIYIAIANNIDSPLLEFDSELYDAAHASALDYEFYKYLTLDFDFDYKDEILKLHMEAKALLKKYSYTEAIAKLSLIESHKSSDSYNAFVFFGVYTDLENAYKQISDFENAYRYSSKRLSLLSAFKT